MKSPPYFELPPEAFPITLRFYRTDTDELVHEMTVPGPGPIHIPAVARKVGQSVRVEAHWDDGTIHHAGPPQ